MEGGLFFGSLPSKYLYICIYYHAYNVLSVHPILKLFFLILKLDYILSDLSVHVYHSRKQKSSIDKLDDRIYRRIMRCNRRFR